MKRLFPLLVVLAFAGCSVSTRHVAVKADTALFEIVDAIHADEQAALCGLPSCAGSPKVEAVPGWTAAKSRAFNQKLLPVVDLAREYNVQLATWKPGTPVPAAVTQAVSGIGDALTVVLKDFPDGQTKTALLTNLGAAQALILNVFNLVLTVKGA